MHIKYGSYPFDRVMPPKRFESGRDKTQVPIEALGLALKYSVKYRRKFANYVNQDDLQEVLNIITNYIDLFQLHDYSEFETLCSPFNYENYLLEIRRNIYFDQCYLVLQLPSKYFNKIIKIFSSFKISNLQFNQELDLIGLLYDNFPLHGCHRFDISEINTIHKNPSKIINRIAGQSIENSYLSIWNDLFQVNSPAKICAVIDRLNNKNQRKFVFINHPCLNLLLFEYIKDRAEKLFREEYTKKYPSSDANDAFADIWGNSFESLVNDAFQANGLTCISKKEYNAKTNPALNEIEESYGETDFILESSDAIIIFECKTKQLSNIAKHGDVMSMIFDIYSGFMFSQYQAKKVEYVLKQQGNILFSDGSSLNLNNRAVVTISLAITETFHSLMDKHFARHLFDYFRKSTFNFKEGFAHPQKNFNSVNKRLTKLNKLVEKIPNHNTHNIYFLSFQQILTLLEHSSNNDEFVSLLLYGRSIVNGSKDGYVDIMQNLYLKKINPNVKTM